MREKPFQRFDMRISKKRLIDELALKFVEVRELRDEVARLKKELKEKS